MSLPDPPWRRHYDAIAPILAVLCILAAFGSVGWSYENQRANTRQDRQHVDDLAAGQAANRQLIDCFNRFATNLAGGLPLVREASAARDDALKSEQLVLRHVLVVALKGKGTPKDGKRLVAALDVYLHAERHLDHVRTAHPYPPPPSSFCS